MTGVGLDGNAAAGALAEFFRIDVTTAIAQCESCGRRAPMADAALFGGETGVVLRCVACEAVLARIVRSDGRALARPARPAGAGVPRLGLTSIRAGSVQLGADEGDDVIADRRVIWCRDVEQVRSAPGSGDLDDHVRSAAHGPMQLELLL